MLLLAVDRNLTLFIGNKDRSVTLGQIFIYVYIGKTRGVMPYYMHKYFPEAAKGTIIEGAELVCVEVPVKALCEECNNEYYPSKENGYLCPVCGGRKAHITEGKGVLLNNVVIED